MIAVGLFAYDSEDIAFAGYSDDVVGLSQGYRLGIQILAVVAIIGWTFVNGMLIFGSLSFFQVLRVDLKTEQVGLDWSEHGGPGYSDQNAYIEKEVKDQKLVLSAKVSAEEGGKLVTPRAGHQQHVTASSAQSETPATSTMTDQRTDLKEVEMQNHVD